MIEETLAYKPLDPAIARLAGGHNHNPEAILAIFQSLQAEQGGLTPEVIEQVARSLGIPSQEAHGVATFYSMLNLPPRPGVQVRICDGVACWLQGAGQLLRLAGERLGPDWEVARTSCLGICDRAPAALVGIDQCGPLSPKGLPAIQSGWRGEQPDYSTPRPGETRHLLQHAGVIDPRSIDSALSYGAYQGLEAALNRPPGEVISTIEASGLRGRGGAGFPAGRKWRLVAQESRVPKYVVCNADESEPLAFKDRVLIDTNPHQILEGMALSAHAVGAQEGFIYIRGEYESQARILESAIQQAEAHQLLGERIQGSDFSFRIHIHRGAGAYICGEETALLESLEGRRGEPRQRPPYPTISGYHNLPTVVNNVETFAAVPEIVLKGADWYRSLGHPDQPGTKLFTLVGHINRPGLFEAQFGLTLNEIITDFGGGMRPGSTAGFALTGGAAGTLVPPRLFDIPIDFSSHTRGISLGAGAILICDQTVSPVAVLRELTHFFEVESCGKCTPCRVGTHQCRVLLDRLLAGDGSQAEIQRVQALSEILQEASFCGLGQFAAMPIKSTLEHFRAAFDSLH